MKNIVFALIVLCTTMASAQKLENALLWKITGNGLSQPSYIFGTIHITCDATLSKDVVEALNETEQLYLELDMDEPSLQTTMMGGMMMKDGKTMSGLTSAENFKAVDEFLTRELGMSAKMVNNFKPAMVATMLYVKMLDCPMQSVEGELMKVTEQQNEEVYGLEKVEDQMAIFDAIPYERQMQELVKTAKDNMAADKKEFSKMMEIYASGNINEMYKMMETSENGIYSEFQDIMLDKRNQKWIPLIEKAAKDKPTFFGVGAAHLGGDNGIINLLRKKGYKVEAVQ